MEDVFPEGFRVNHRITDTDSWHILTDCAHGLKYMEREKPSFDRDGDFDTRNLKMMSTFRGRFGWTDPHGAYACAGN